MMMSSPEEKLSWIFEIFDADGGAANNLADFPLLSGGIIEMDELEEVVEGIFKFAGITVRKCKFII